MSRKKKPTTKGRLGNKSRRHDISASASMIYLDFMAIDHSYFKRHKRSEYRIRRIMPGEIQGGLTGLSCPPGLDPTEVRAAIEAGLSSHTHTVVRRLGPGTHARKFFTLPDIPGHKWSEEDARSLFLEGWMPLPVFDFPPPVDGKWPEPPRAPVVPMQGGKQ